MFTLSNINSLKYMSMKKILLTLVVPFVLGYGGLTAQEVSPFYRVTASGGIPSLSDAVKAGFEAAGFDFLGSYHPGGDLDLFVLVFTRDDLRKMTFSLPDRGALASVLKAGMMKTDAGTEISVVNPVYMFYAYLRDGVRDYTPYQKISDDFKGVLATWGKPEPFGEALEVNKLKKYHYMMGMPYFDDPVKLHTFGSFEEGLETIRKNLDAGKGKTVKVYELVDTNGKTALFGVGLQDPEKGEKHFLPIIGESHVAAMPYEIILQGQEATMLHGRFRFALYWPGLTMKTFTKIMSTPGDVEDMLKALTE